MNTRETKEISQAWDKVAPGDDDFVTPTDVGSGAEALCRAGLRTGIVSAKISERGA